MKLIVALFSVLFSFNILAETGEEVCNAISFSSDRQTCFNIINGRYFDLDAGFVCKRAKFNSGRLDCVKVAIDKEYTPDEAYECDRTSFDSDRLQCMREKGIPTYGDPSHVGRLRTIRGFSARALMALDQGDIRSAYVLLARINQISNVGETK